MNYDLPASFPFFVGDYLKNILHASKIVSSGDKIMGVVFLHASKILLRQQNYVHDWVIGCFLNGCSGWQLHRYAVEHIARAVRVLRQEGGHLLCVGVGGSGRQSLSRLAGFIAGMEVFQVSKCVLLQHCKCVLLTWRCVEVFQECECATALRTLSCCTYMATCCAWAWGATGASRCPVWRSSSLAWRCSRCAKCATALHTLSCCTGVQVLQHWRMQKLL